MRRHLALVPLLAVALASVSLGAAPVATQDAFSGAAGHLAYVDFQGLDDIGHIVKDDLDTDAPIELTGDVDTVCGDADPSWSPGGTMVAPGTTGGSGGGKYCPLRNVTRGEMAAFLHRAFE